MPANPPDGARTHPAHNPAGGGPPVEPHVRNANRIVVGFPFSTISIEDHASAAEVADVVAQLCRLLENSAPADAFAELAVEAEDLRDRLWR